MTSDTKTGDRMNFANSSEINSVPSAMPDEWKKLPPDMIPKINELPGDLSQVATIIEQIAPGKGVAATLALAEHFRGTTCYWHNLDALTRKTKYRRIKERFDAGDRVPEIARSVGLSARRVWEILGSEPVDDRQGRLW